MRDRARGALLGAAVGDALGRPLEFHRAPGPEDVEAALALRPLVWTDDTALTIALGESLAALGTFDEDHAAQSMGRMWRENPMRGYSKTTARTLAAVDAGKDWRLLAMPSWGNGATMRVSPIPRGAERTEYHVKGKVSPLRPVAHLPGFEPRSRRSRRPPVPTSGPRRPRAS